MRELTKVIDAKTLKRFSIAFDGLFKWEITTFSSWFQIVSAYGFSTFYSSKEFSREDVRALNPNDEVKEQKGYGVRLSVTGCMDWTKWKVFESAQEAAEYLEYVLDVSHN